jgi:phytoene dehydrogenase-like protein
MGQVVVRLSRRELLTAFLGAPFAAIACRDRAPSLPPGELVGASHQIGHRLRSSSTADRRLPTADWETHEVAIVGGGIAGLAAAWRLKRAGVRDVVLLELEQQVGGTSRSGASFPWGAHYIIAPSESNHVLRELLDEMGILENGEPAEQYLVRDPEERLFYRGRWYEGLYLYAGASHEDLRQLRAFEAEIARWSAWRDAKGRRAFDIPLAFGSDDADVTALDKRSMADWLDARQFTSPRLRWYVEYACRDDYGTLLHDTSAWAAIFYFASRDARPVITWADGNGHIVKHLARSAPARTGWLATHITPQGEITALRGDEVRGIRAKRVIFAAPQFIAKHIIPSRETSSAFTYGSWMVANLALRERPRSHGFPPAWDNVLYDSPSLGYVTATHQQGIEHGPTTLTYYYALCGSDPHRERERLLAGGRDAWAEVALADLSRAHPDIRTLTTRVDIMRWGHAMVRPTPGFVWSDARRNAAQPHGAIHFANTDLSGVALCEEALHHGVRAADEVIAAFAT